MSVTTPVSDQISHSVVSDSLRPHESQHARPPCPSPTPGVHSNSHPLSQKCHPTISPSAAHGTTDWFQIGKGVHQGCILSPCLFNFYAEFSSVAQSCLTLCDSLDCSTPGLPVHHQLPEFTETHVHRVSDAIQPSHPLSFPSPPAPNPSQHQSLFQRVNSLHQVAKVLEF